MVLEDLAGVGRHTKILAEAEGVILEGECMPRLGVHGQEGVDLTGP